MATIYNNGQFVKWNDQNINSKQIQLHKDMNNKWKADQLMNNFQKKRIKKKTENKAD